MRKIRNVHFVGNFIPSTCWEFYYDDFILTSFVSIKCGVVAIESFPQRTLCNEHCAVFPFYCGQKHLLQMAYYHSHTLRTVWTWTDEKNAGWAEIRVWCGGAISHLSVAYTAVSIIFRIRQKLVDRWDKFLMNFDSILKNETLIWTFKLVV